MRRTVTLVLTLLIVGMNLATARTFYVALNGNNNNPGSMNQPWRTLSFATSMGTDAGPGDTIYVRAGNYPEIVTPQTSGAAGAPMFMLNYQAEVVTLNPGRFSFPNGINYWKLKGLHILHSSDSGIVVSGTHPLGFLIVDHCELSHHKENGINLMNAFGGVHVYDCIIEWNGEINGQPSGVEGTGIVMYGSAGKLWAKRNWIAHNWAKGISHGSEAEWQTDGSFVDSNLIIDNFESGCDWWGDNTSLSHNYFSLNGTRDTEQDEWGDKALAINGTGSNNMIAFNVIKSSGRWELDPRGGQNKFYNNTLLKDHYYNTIPGSPYAAAIIFWAANHPGNEFRNNIIINWLSQPEHHFAIIAETYLRYTDQIWSNNLYWCPNASAAPPYNRPFKLYGAPGGIYETLAQIQANWPNQEVGSIWASPAFISLTDSNLTLQPTSPAIDGGMYVGFPFNGQAPDMGAFEFAAGSTPPWSEQIMLNCITTDGDKVSFLLLPPNIPVLMQIGAENQELLKADIEATLKLVHQQ